MSQSNLADLSRLNKSWLKMTMEELMEEIERTGGKMKEPILFEFENHVDSSTTGQKPRERTFLIDLIRDTFYLIYLIAHEIATVTRLSEFQSDLSKLPHDANVLANQLGKLLDECRKLNAAPELFPSPSLREAFLMKIGSLCSILGSIDEIVEQNRSFATHISNPFSDFEEPLRMPDNDHDKIRSTLHKAKVVRFHPHRPGAKNPWNNWLDNSAKPAPGWIGIQQKIPRIGCVMNRKKVHEYDAIESRVEQDQLLPRNHENETPQIPEVGDEFRHMTWSGFATAPRFNVGFRKGTRRHFDDNDIVTLETLSLTAQKFYPGRKDLFVRRGPPRRRVMAAPNVIRARKALSSNVPYFRFAMAHEP